MADRRDRWNSFFTAVIFGAFGVGAIHALIVITAVFPIALAGMAFTLSVIADGSADQIQGAEWAAFLPAVAKNLVILGACTVVVLGAGYGARRTAGAPRSTGTTSDSSWG